MSNTAKWWDKNAQKYFASPIKDEAAYQRKLETTRQYFTPDSEVLEFGCGTGGTAILHAPYVKSVLATDISEEMLAIGRKQAEEAGVSNVRFEQADFETLASEPGRYDVVLGLSILHLLKDRRSALAKIRTLLKPGGVFVSSTVCIGNKMWFMAPILWLGRMIGLFPFVRVFTTGQLIRSLEEAGFIIEKQPSSGGSVAFIVARKPD